MTVAISSRAEHDERHYRFARVRSDRGRVDLERTPPIRSIWDRLEKPGAAAAGVIIGLGICMLVLG